jgi:hypothetical protein
MPSLFDSSSDNDNREDIVQLFASDSEVDTRQNTDAMNDHDRPNTRGAASNMTNVAAIILSTGDQEKAKAVKREKNWLKR